MELHSSVQNRNNMRDDEDDMDADEMELEKGLDAELRFLDEDLDSADYWDEHEGYSIYDQTTYSTGPVYGTSYLEAENLYSPRLIALWKKKYKKRLKQKKRPKKKKFKRGKRRWRKGGSLKGKDLQAIDRKALEYGLLTPRVKRRLMRHDKELQQLYAEDVELYDPLWEFRMNTFSVTTESIEGEEVLDQRKYWKRFQLEGVPPERPFVGWLRDVTNLKISQPIWEAIPILLKWSAILLVHMLIYDNSPGYWLVYFIYNPIKWLFKLVYAFYMGLPRPDFFDSPDPDLFLKAKNMGADGLQDIVYSKFTLH